MKLIDKMKRARFIKYGTSMIFVCDLSDLDTEDACQVIRHGEDIIKRMPKRTVLAVARLANVKHDALVEGYLKRLIAQCDPHVLRGAISGITDQRLKAGLEKFILLMGEKHVESFNSYDDAVSWLVKKAA